MIPMRIQTVLHVQEMQQCMKVKHEGEHGKGSTQMQPDIYGSVMDEMAYSENHASPHTQAHE